MNKEVGIYKIECLANGKTYIGSSIMLTHRLKNHVYMLNKQKHRNGRLQNAWNKYGAEAFVFEVVFNCAKDQMREIEAEFMERFDAANLGFNISTDTAAPMQGMKHSEAALKKMRAARVGFTYSDEAKAKMSAALKGRTLGAEHREKISSGGKGISKSEETKQRMRESAALRPQSRHDKVGKALAGKPKSEDHKKRLSEVAKIRCSDPEYIKKLSAAQLAIVTDERRSRISANNVARMKDPAERAKISKALTGRKASEETKAKLSAVHKGKKLSEEQKRLLSQLATARWAAKKAAQT